MIDGSQPHGHPVAGPQLWRAFAAVAFASVTVCTTAVTCAWFVPQTPLLPARAVISAAHGPIHGQAVDLLCRGRHAEAYGRFVALADDGDRSAGRIALALHHLGPTLFASEWDASAEQLEQWARWSRRTGEASPALSSASSELFVNALCEQAAAIR